MAGGKTKPTHDPRYLPLSWPTLTLAAGTNTRLLPFKLFLLTPGLKRALHDDPLFQITSLLDMTL